MISVNNDFGKTQVSSAYPNPSIIRKVTVDVTIQKAGNGQPQVFSSTGILYSSTNVALQKGYNQVTLDLKGHPLN